jgi:hypothetical protein
MAARRHASPRPVWLRQSEKYQLADECRCNLNERNIVQISAVNAGSSAQGGVNGKLDSGSRHHLEQAI